MKSIIYICPKGTDKPRGGIKIIYKHAEVLSKLLLKKNECKIFHFEDVNYRCGWFPHNVNFKTNLSFDSEKEFAIIPEWMAVYHAKILQKQNIKYAIFVLNGFYINKKPEKNFTDAEICEAYKKAEFILSCADEITEDIKLIFPELKEKIVRVKISVDSEKYYCSEEIFKNKENLITYMPRKKKNNSEILIFILNRLLPKNWRIESIDSLTELEVANFFRKPIVLVNIQFRSVSRNKLNFKGKDIHPKFKLSKNKMLEFTGEDIFFIPQKYLNLETNKYLTFSEMLNSDVGLYIYDYQFKRSKIKVVNNTSEEIMNVVEEMNLFLDGKLELSNEDLKLQQDFWIKFKNEFTYSENYKISPYFLRQNQHLLQ